MNDKIRNNLINGLKKNSHISQCKKRRMIANLTSAWRYVPPVTVDIDPGLADIVLNEVKNTTQTGTMEWTTDRHDDYPTNDLPVTDELPNTTNLVNSLIEDFSEVYSKHFDDVDSSCIMLEEAFVARYSPEKQSSLAEHTDGSTFSFVCALNDNFQGGGTHFVELDQSFHPKKGQCVLFAGGMQKHMGLPTTDGTRYILTGFLNYGIQY